MKKLSIYRYDGKLVVIDSIETAVIHGREIVILRPGSRKTNVSLGGSDLAILEDV